MQLTTTVALLAALASQGLATPVAYVDHWTFTYRSELTNSFYSKKPAPPAPKEGLWTAMRARGRNFIGTAVTFRNDTAEAAIYGNKADFNS